MCCTDWQTRQQQDGEKEMPTGGYAVEKTDQPYGTKGQKLIIDVNNIQASFNGGLDD